MKINAVRIHNLASIVDAEIDFTKAPLKDAGLFAITGDTGAGKSTFLDAICLALYTKTARLRGDKGNLIDFNGDNIKLNDPRNLLRRGTWQGYAEVDFVGQDKQLYRARYVIQRAHKKVTGKLKTAEHSLFILPEQSLIAEKSQTIKEIENKIGLSFEQFSRAVLLAQHEFAAFLKATGDERAQLLECLTGTDKFSVIGKRIFERHKEQQEKLALLKASLASYTLLSDTELAQKSTELTAINKQLDAIKQQLANTEQGVNWYKQAHNLEQALQQAKQNQQHASRALDDIAQQSEQAKQAQSARAIKENRNRFDSLNEQQKLLQNKINDLKAIDHKTRINELAERVSQHRESLTKAKQQQLDAEPVIIKARALDNQIALSTQTLSTLTQQYQQQQQKAEQQQQQLTQTQATYSDGKHRLEQYQNWLSQHAPLQAVANDWNYYQHSFKQFFNLKQQLTTNSEQKERTNKEQLNYSTQLNKKTEDVKVAEQTLHTEQQNLEKLNTQQSQFDIVKCDTELKNIEYLKEQRERYKQLKQELKESEKQLHSIATKLNNSEQQQGLLKQGLNNAEQTLKHSEYALNQARLRASEHVEHLRAQLTPNEPCTVCGATAHPYVTDQPLTNLITDFETDHRKAKQECEQAQALLNAHLTQHAILQTEHTQLSQTMANTQSKLNEITAIMQAARNELNELNAEQLEARYQQLSAQKTNYFTVQQQQQVLQQQVNQLQQSLKQEQQTQQQLHEQYLELSNQLRHLETKHQELNTEYNELYQRLNEQFANADFWPQLQQGTIQLTELQKQVTQYQQTLEQLEQTQKQQDIAAQQTQQLAPLVAESEQTLAKLTLEQQQTQQQLHQLETERLALFNNEKISADAYQTKLAEQTEQCQIQLNNSQKAHDSAIKQRDEQLITLNNDEQRLLDNKQEQAQLATSYEQWFSEFSSQYPDVNHELIKILLTHSHDEIKAQLAQHEQLTLALTDAQAALKQQQLAISQHQSHAKPSETLAELTTLLNQLSEQQSAMQKSQLALNTALELHHQNSQALQSKQQELSSLQTQLEQWHILNKVLGDKEGKKMRNLAQAQTLRILLHYANSHLKILNKRYELIAIAHSLDIAIIDRDMADEQRSVNTLSGGESFLVSLALALGLASLSSNKVQINSLFIDEGFGTLDSDTLSIAMDALDSLQAQGRKVGVISHVAEMTERVATQVHVAKRPGGYSRVEII